MRGRGCEEVGGKGWEKGKGGKVLNSHSDSLYQGIWMNLGWLKWKPDEILGFSQHWRSISAEQKKFAIRLLLLKPEKAGWSRLVLSVDINVPIYILNYRSWKKFSIKFRKKFCFYTLCVCSRKYAPFFPPLTLSCHWPLCCSLFFDWLLSSPCYYHHVIQSKALNMRYIHFVVASLTSWQPQPYWLQWRGHRSEKP